MKAHLASTAALAALLLSPCVAVSQSFPPPAPKATVFSGASQDSLASIAAATKLSFVQQPSNAFAGAVITPAVTVQLVDNAGIPVPQAGVSIALSLSSGTGTLSGTTTRITDAGGLARFPDISINLLGSKKLKASAAGLSSATSNSFTILLGPAVRLRIQTEPSPTATAGVVFSQQPIVWLEDAGGNRVTTDNSTVVSASRLAGTGALQGTLTATAQAGIAAFANLSHIVADTITLWMTSGSLLPDTSTSIRVGSGPAARLMFLQGPTNAGAGARISPAVTVALKDAFGNEVTTTGTPVSMSLSSGTGTLSGTVTKSTAAGIATFDNLSINLVGTKSLTASSGTLTAAVSAPFSIAPGAPRTVAFVQQPTNAVAASPIAPPITVQVGDSLGNDIALPGVSVSIALSSGTGLLSGVAVQQTNAAGLATFSGLSINLAGSKTLAASSAGLATSASTPFTIAPGAAAQLAFVQSPSTTVAGVAIAPAITVQLRDAQGNAVRAPGISVSVALSSGTGILTGTIPQITDASGVSTFNNLSINFAGVKTLTASGNGLASATSGSFTILPGPAAKLEFTTSPVGGGAGAAFTIQPVVTLEDAFGNPVTGLTQIVTLAIQRNAGPGGILSGTRVAPVNTSTGQAIFAGLSIDKSGVGYTLTATGSTVSTTPGVVVSAPFTITASSPLTIRVENAPDGSGTLLGPQNVTSGTSITVYAISRDAFGNFVANSAADAWSILNRTGGVVATDLVPSVDRKSAAFTGRIVGTGAISATLAGLTATPTGTLTVVVAGTPTRIRVETAADGTGIVVPARTVLSGSSITVYAVGRDAAGNYISNLAAESWTLQGKLGSVVDGDLVGSADRKSATFTGRLLGSAQIRAASATLVGTSSGTLTVIAGAPANITASAGTPQQANVGTSFPVRFAANVRDAAGNLAPGAQVSWSAPDAGPSGSFASGGSVAVTDSSGFASSGVFTANGVAGSYTVIGAVPGMVPTAAYALTNVFGIPARIATASGSPQSGQILTPFAVPLAAIVRDALGNAVAGVAVTFRAPAKGPGGTFPGVVRIATVPTNSAGVATAPTFTANEAVGSYLVEASALGVSSPALFEMTNRPGTPASLAVSGGSGQSTAVGTAFPVRLSATVQDASGNPLQGIPVTFIAPATGPGGRFARGSADTVLSDTSGIATASVFIATLAAGPFTVTARAAGVALPASFTLTSQPGPVDTFVIGAASGGSIGTQIAQVPFNLRVSARDQYGNVASAFTGIAEITSNGILSQAGGTTPPFTAGELPSYTVALLNAGRFSIVARRVGGAETGNTDTFQVVNPAPFLQGISPALGRRGETLTVTLTGTGFIRGATTVSFGDRISTSTVVTSSTQMMVTLTIDTAAAVGVRDVIVYNGPPGGGVSNLPASFVIGNNPVPVLTSVTPNVASVLRRLTLVFTGDNFVGGVTRAGMGAGILVHSISVDSTRQLTADVSLGASAPSGVRKIVLTNDPPGGGTSASVDFLVESPATPYPVLDSPGQGAVLLDTVVKFVWHPWQPSEIAYRLQLSTSPSFTTMIIDDSTIVDTVGQVGFLLRGQTYFWRVGARNAVGASETSPARTLTITPEYLSVITVLDTVPFPAYPSTGSYQPTDYRIVGIPGNSDGLLTAYLEGKKDVDWVAYWDNGADKDYLKPFNESSPFQFSLGRAYWILRRGPLVVSAKVRAAPLDSTGSVRIPLHPGWNLITNPFGTTLSWPSVQSANGPGVVADLWSYNGTFARTTEFRPSRGYLVDNPDQRTGLRIPYAPILRRSIGKETPSNDSSGWRVGIQMSTGSVIDRSASFGVAAGAKRGRDPLDLRMPRGVGSGPGVVFDRPEWEQGGGRFAADIRPEFEGVESWPLNVYATPQQPAEVAFTGLSSIPEKHAIALIDDDRNFSLDLRSRSSYHFTPATPVSRFRVLVGNAEAIHEILNSILPREFALGNSFPNPFNPTSTIPVSVPRKSEVTLKVYTILGEEVRRLHDGVLEAGRHWFVWDGKNDHGLKVASGIYLVRLSTDTGRRFVGKLILAK